MSKGRWKSKTSGNGKHGLFTFVLYPDSQADIIGFVQKNWPCAWALHDMDKYDEDSYAAYKEHNDGKSPEWNPGDLKKPHIHFLYKPRNDRSIHGVAHEMGVPDNVVCVGDNERALYDYLYHKDDATKYRYDKSIVQCHDYDEPSEDASAYISDKAQARQILSIPPEVDTYEKLIDWALDRDCWECLSTKFPMWRVWFEERKEHLAILQRAERLAVTGDSSASDKRIFDKFHPDAANPETWYNSSEVTPFDESEQTKLK